jgi:uncharacterized protein (DUF302 family)
MKPFQTIACVVLMLLFSANVQASDAYVQIKSAYSVTETLDRLEAILKQKGITVFARVDHAAGAEKVGLEMNDTQLLIFGNPRMGTPLMNEQILMGLDLPMKMLAWKDDSGQTWLAYTRAEALQQRHQLKNQQIIEKMSKALEAMSQQAIEN